METGSYVQRYTSLQQLCLDSRPVSKRFMAFGALIEIILTIRIYRGHIARISNASFTTAPTSFLCDRCGPCSSCPVLLA